MDSNAPMYPGSTFSICPSSNTYSVISPANSRNAVPVPEISCRKKPSPPNRPAPIFLLNFIFRSTPVCAIMNASRWQIIDCPFISNGTIFPGNSLQNDMMPVPVSHV